MALAPTRSGAEIHGQARARQKKSVQFGHNGSAARMKGEFPGNRSYPRRDEAADAMILLAGRIGYSLLVEITIVGVAI
jgi:hypothetical protein